MEAFFVSAAVVAVAEIGDKTQLLALMLAARYRKPIPIILGMLLATLANHALAAWVGSAVAGWIGADTMRWILGATFIVMAGWCLIPDKADEGPRAARQAGAFVATLVSFFLVEIGDKTQLATVALAARFNALVLVTAGTTFGMLLANTPVVLFGDAIARRLPLKIVRAVAALLFLALGLAALFMPSAP
ncbi:MAG TPA: TMEM165/GDT1 family protein [Reyranella sp.]|jgi:putative Ca2+/H+ antiporter (TMEM165/GDT1 family)|nr:TMEM165/GDT1 family protein [Reyranella sp.]